MRKINPEKVAGGKSGKAMPSKKSSKSEKAGLVFSVARVHRKLKEGSSRHLRVAGTAAVYMAAIMEYLVAEVVELAGNASHDLKVKRVTPRHLYLAIRGDEELDSLIHATLAGGGVIPHIHRALIKQKNQSSQGNSQHQAQSVDGMKFNVKK